MKDRNAISFILFFLACILAFGAFMLLTGCIYPHELRKDIVQPTYDDWETGYAETSPEIIMAQLDGEVRFYEPTDLDDDRVISSWNIGVGCAIEDRLICLSDLIAYERECYNDSTQVTEHVGGGMGCVGVSTGYGDFKCQSYGHYDHQVWRHKQPTFTGFIDWLQNKQK